MSKTIYGGAPSNNNQPVSQPAPVGKGTVVLPGGNTNPRIAQQNPLIGFLVSFSRGTTGECWELREGNLYVLGKGADTDILLGEKSVSDHHATIQIRRSNDDEKRLMIVISDTNSTNGTVVNGKDIGINGHISLQHHDKILVGNYELVVMLIDRDRLLLNPHEKFESTAATTQPAANAYDYSDQSLYNKKTQAG